MMQEVNILNQELLDILNGYLWFYENKSFLDDKKLAPMSSDKKHLRDEHVSDDYLNKLLRYGSAHSGYPEELYGHNIKELALGANVNSEWTDRWIELNNRMHAFLAVRGDAANTLYPPGGYISWHNNANAYGFNLIFTWSETGEGDFRYLNDDKSIVKLHDKPGKWVCRYGHFGSYDNPKYPVVYHAATTDCWRITLGYIFGEDQMHGDFQQFLLDEIETP